MKDQKGISMVVLIITIIIMLILAGVALAMVTGDGSLLDQANNAEEETRQAQAEEEVEIAWSSAEVDYWSKYNKYSKEDFFESELKNYIGDVGVIESIEYNEGGKSIINYKSNTDGQVYIVEIDTSSSKGGNLPYDPEVDNIE